jgi:hypothetical protein
LKIVKFELAYIFIGENFDGDYMYNYSKDKINVEIEKNEGKLLMIY